MTLAFFNHDSSAKLKSCAFPTSVTRRLCAPTHIQYYCKTLQFTLPFCFMVFPRSRQNRREVTPS